MAKIKSCADQSQIRNISTATSVLKLAGTGSQVTFLSKNGYEFIYINMIPIV